MGSLQSFVRSSLSIPALFLFLSVAVTATGLIALQPDEHLFWIPAGLTFAFLFRYGMSMCLAAILGESLAYALTGHGFLHAFASGLSSVIAVLPLVLMQNRLKVSLFDRQNRPAERVLFFLLVALPLSSYLRQITDFSNIGSAESRWLEWYLREMTGVMFPGLPLLLWNRIDRYSGDAARWERILVSGLFVSSLPVVFSDDVLAASPLPFAYLPALLVLWIALRMGALSGSAAMFLLGLIAYIGTSMQQGPFADLVGALRIYLAVLSIIAFLLSTLIKGETERLQTQLKQDTLFRLFLEQTKDVIFRSEVGPNRGPEPDFLSPSMKDFLGYEPSEFIRDRSLIARLIHPDDQHVLQKIRSLENDLFEAEYRVFDRQGRLHWAEIRQVTVRDASGNPVAVEGMLRDVSDRKEASLRIVHLNALLHSIRQVNQLITRERNAETVLRESASILIQNRGYMLVWIGLPDSTGNRLTIAAAAGEASGYTDGLIITLDETETGLGPSGTAWRTGEPVLFENVQSNPAFAPWKERASEFGIHSSLTIPLIHDKHRYGLINVYLNQWLRFSEEEVELLKEVAGDIAYSLYNIDREAEIERLAYFDPLTDLANRRLLLDHLEHGMAFLRRRNRFGALFYLDLDNFKHVNDSFGHETGDEILREVARRLRTRLREEDTVARLGGDEFVVLLFDLGDTPEDAAVQAQLVAEEIQQTLLPPCRVNGNTFNLTPSIGVTILPRYEQTPHDVLREADTAMYRTKMEGRNGFRFFHPDMQRMAELRVSMEQEMHRGLSENEFLLHYQPQVDSQHQLIGMEALLRWEHPSRGILGPDQYIGIAEETGLIVPLGRRVLSMACAQQRKWKDQNFGGTVAINISARQFRDPRFVSDVKTILAETGADPSALLFEITESVFLDSIDDSVEKMEELCTIGIRFSVDDFGTGYSSLTYLKRLPVYEIKIDRSFTRDALTNDFSRAIIRTILTIAEHLNMTVIAEGVEDEDQKQLLIELGCHRFQGYHTGRPAPADQLLLRF